MSKLTISETRDQTIAEIHKIREQLSDRFKGDLHAIVEDARKRQEQSGRVTVSYAESHKVAFTQTNDARPN